MKILVTNDFPKVGIDLLSEKFEVKYNSSGIQMTKQEMLDEFPKYDAIVSSLVDNIDEEILNSCSNVKVISNYAVGYNNIDINSAKKNGIIITNTPDILSDTTAETAWALLFSVARQVVKADKFIRDGKWKGHLGSEFLGRDIYNKTVGIIGAGSIGRRFAEKTRGYNMNILYHNRNRDLEFEKQYNSRYVTKEELMKESDFISLHMPLTDETYHMIGEKELALMKETAILINTARGSVVDQEALIKALQQNKIYGAGLDVFEDEPNVPKELIELDNVVMLPHIGSSTTETRNKMAELVAHNIINILEGKDPITPVN